MAEKSILEEFGEKSKDGDQLIAYTLQAIANMQRGGSEDILYKAMTKGGEPRYMHKNIQGLPTDERRAWQANMLRSQIEQDPTFADTLSHEEGMERVAPRQSITSKILKALGIYQEGGEVSRGTYSVDRRILDKLVEKDGKFGAEGFWQIERPEGKRWYSGKGSSPDLGFSVREAAFDALSRAHTTPEDSLITGGLPIEEVLANLASKKGKK